MKKMTKRKKQQIRRTVVLVIAAGIITAAVLGVVLSVTGYIYNRYFAKNPVIAYDKIRVDQPEITEDFLTVNENSRPGIKLEKVNGIVIHYTANPGTGAKANRDYFESRKDQENTAVNKVSSHFVVGLDGEIIQCIPTWEIAYASNDRNSDTVSIECCHPDDTGKFTESTYRSMVQLTAWLCKKFELDENAVIRHYDVTGKICPKYFVEDEEAWNQFKADVKNALKKE